MSARGSVMSVAEQDIRDDGSDNRPIAYTEGSRIYIRASAVGGSSHCIAAALAGIDPVPHTEKTKQYMAEGVLHEPAIMSYLGTQGWMLHNIGRDQAELDIPITSRLIVRCHPDGLATANIDMDHGVTRGMKCVVEAKAMSEGVFDTYSKKGFDEFYRYAVQLSLQMQGTGLPGLFAIKNRNTGEVRWQVFHDPPVAFSEIKKRLLLVEKRARNGELNPLKEKCSSFPCTYFFLHDDEPAPTAVDEVLDNLAEMVDRARERRKLAEDMEKEAKRRITAQMGDREKVRTARWSVTMVSGHSSRFDREKAEGELGVNLEPFYSRKEYTYPLIKSTGKGEG